MRFYGCCGWLYYLAVLHVRCSSFARSMHGHLQSQLAPCQAYHSCVRNLTKRDRIDDWEPGCIYLFVAVIKRIVWSNHIQKKLSFFIHVTSMLTIAFHAVFPCFTPRFLPWIISGHYISPRKKDCCFRWRHTVTSGQKLWGSTLCASRVATATVFNRLLARISTLHLNHAALWIFNKKNTR